MLVYGLSSGMPVTGNLKDLYSHHKYLKINLHSGSGQQNVGEYRAPSGLPLSPFCLCIGRPIKATFEFSYVWFHLLVRWIFS